MNGNLENSSWISSPKLSFCGAPWNCKRSGLLLGPVNRDDAVRIQALPQTKNAYIAVPKNMVPKAIRVYLRALAAFSCFFLSSASSDVS